MISTNFRTDFFTNKGLPKDIPISEVRSSCREVLTNNEEAETEEQCIQFLTHIASEERRSCYQIFVGAAPGESNLLQILVERLGSATPEFRTFILSCLNSVNMPEYLIPAFLGALESVQWQTRMQSILALQILHHTFSESQKMVLQDSLDRILDSDSSDLVRQAAKQTLLLWDEWLGPEGAGGGNGKDLEQIETEQENQNQNNDNSNIIQNSMNNVINESMNNNISSLDSMPASLQINPSITSSKEDELNKSLTELTNSLQDDMIQMKNNNSNMNGIITPSMNNGQLLHNNTPGSIVSTAINTSFNSSGDSMLLNSNNIQNAGIASQGTNNTLQSSEENPHQWLIPEEFLNRLRDHRSTQVLEEIHRVILGETLPINVLMPNSNSGTSMDSGGGGGSSSSLAVPGPPGSDNNSTVSLQDMGVLKRLIDLMLQIPNFKVTLTSLYIIGDLVSHPSNKIIQENTIKVLPLVLTKILGKLGDSKFVIRQTTTKLLAKIVEATDCMQLAYLMFEEVENSSTNLAKCEALISVLTLTMLAHNTSGQQSQTDTSLVKLISARLWKWFEKAYEERFAILIGEALAVASRLLSQSFSSVNADEYINSRQHYYSNNERQQRCLLRVLKTQVSTSREANSLPYLSGEGLVEYPSFVNSALEAAGSSRVAVENMQVGNQVSPIYDIFGQKRCNSLGIGHMNHHGMNSHQYHHGSMSQCVVPPPILKKLDDDHVSVASGSTTSSRRPRMSVTFSDDGTSNHNIIKGTNSNGSNIGSGVNRCMTPVREVQDNHNHSNLNGTGVLSNKLSQQNTEGSNKGTLSRVSAAAAAAAAASSQVQIGFNPGQQQIGGSSSSSSQFQFDQNLNNNQNQSQGGPNYQIRDGSMERTGSTSSNMNLAQLRNIQMSPPLLKTGSISSVNSNCSASIKNLNPQNSGTGPGGSAIERRSSLGSVGSDGSGGPSGPGQSGSNNVTNGNSTNSNNLNGLNGLNGLISANNSNAPGPGIGNMSSANSNCGGSTASRSNSRRRPVPDFNKTHRKVEGQPWHEKSTPKLPQNPNSNEIGQQQQENLNGVPDDSRPDTRQQLIHNMNQNQNQQHQNNLNQNLPLSRCSGRSNATSVVTASTRAYSQTDEEAQSAISASVSLDGVGDMKTAFLNLKSIDRTTSGKTFNNNSSKTYNVVNNPTSNSSLLANTLIAPTPSPKKQNSNGNFSNNGGPLTGNHNGINNGTNSTNSLLTSSEGHGPQQQQSTNHNHNHVNQNLFPTLTKSQSASQSNSQNNNVNINNSGSNSNVMNSTPMIPPGSRGHSMAMVPGSAGGIGMGSMVPGSAGGIGININNSNNNPNMQEVESFLSKDLNLFARDGPVLSPEIKEKLKLLKTRRPSNLGGLPQGNCRAAMRSEGSMCSSDTNLEDFRDVMSAGVQPFHDRNFASTLYPGSGNGNTNGMQNQYSQYPALHRGSSLGHAHGFGGPISSFGSVTHGPGGYGVQNLNHQNHMANNGNLSNNHLNHGNIGGHGTGPNGHNHLNSYNSNNHMSNLNGNVNGHTNGPGAYNKLPNHGGAFGLGTGGYGGGVGGLSYGSNQLNNTTSNNGSGLSGGHVGRRSSIVRSVSGKTFGLTRHGQRSNGGGGGIGPGQGPESESFCVFFN